MLVNSCRWVAVVLVLQAACVLVQADTYCSGVTYMKVNCTDFAVGRGPLKLNGVQLVDQYDNRVQLRGLSSHGLQYAPECVTKESIAYLVGTWGINVFRAAVYVDEWLDGYTTNATFFDNFIEDIVYWCKDLGIYVIIDWHIIGDPNAYLDEWYRPTSGLALDFFRNVSYKYQNETHVLYEIANEPTLIPWNNLAWYHNLIISGIRENDPDAIIIVGTPDYSQALDLVNTKMIIDPENVMYAFHFNAATDESLLSVLGHYMHRIPVFVSQFSMTDRTGEEELNHTVARDFLDMMAGINDKKEPITVVSWTLWGFSDLPDDVSSALIPTSCSSQNWYRTSCSGKYVENYCRARLYEDPELDCDVEVKIPSSKDIVGLNDIDITIIFLAIIFVAGCLSSIYYYHHSRKQNRENEKTELAMYLSYPRQKFGNVKFGALQQKRREEKRRKEGGETGKKEAVNMEIGNIYGEGTDGKFSGNRIDSQRSMRNKMPLPPSSDEWSQRSDSPPPSSAATLLSTERPKSTKSVRSRSPSPTRPQSYRGSPPRSPSTRSRYAAKSPTRNTRKVPDRV